MSTNDYQIDGSHYHTSNVQHWDAVVFSGSGYLEGCCTKYLARWRQKNGLTDLHKAEHYLDKLIELVEHDLVSRHPVRRGSKKVITDFIEDAKIPYPESLIIFSLLQWQSYPELLGAREAIKDLIAANDGSAPGPGYVNQD